jgi:hypothetical protein
MSDYHPLGDTRRYGMIHSSAATSISCRPYDNGTYARSFEPVEQKKFALDEPYETPFLDFMAPIIGTLIIISPILLLWWLYEFLT